MELVTVRISDLVPDPENPRSHPAENVEAIAKSLERFGQVLPLLVRDSDCRVVAGNGTLEAMKRLGWTEAKVALYDGGDEECRALSVALNRTAELATWDEENLAKACADLKAAGFEGLDALGFNASELDVFEKLSSGEAIRAVDVDPYVEWQGMPKYDNGNAEAFRVLVVHFVDQAAVDKFAGALGVALSPNARYLWLPEASVEKSKGKGWVDAA